MPKTVIHFTDASEFGGAEQVMLQTIMGLDRNQWRSVVFYHDEAGLDRLVGKLRGSNINIRAVPRIEGLRDINRLPQFIRAIRDEAPAIFHAHLTWALGCKYGLIGALVAGVPAIVATAHTCQEFPVRQFLLRAQRRLIALAVHQYIAVSKAVACALCATSWIPPRKIRIVYNGVCVATPNGHCQTDRQKLSQRSPVVLTTGRLSKEKGHEYLLMAVALVPDVMVMIAGEGPEKASLKARARELGISDRVSFLGYQENIADLLAKCDVFVLPSLTEGLPLSVLEAMAASRAVVASDVGGNKEVVAHGETGLLVPPHDATALAEAVRTIAFDSALARRFGEAAKARVEREFSHEDMVRRVTEIYSELLDSRMPRQASV